MADEGGFSVWGAEEEDISAPTTSTLIPIGPPKGTPKLFGDLDEADADWGVQPSYEPDIGGSQTHKPAAVESSLPAESTVVQDTLFEEDDVAVNEATDQLDSTGFDDFEEAQFADGGNKLADDDDFGDFGDFDDEQDKSAFEETVVPSESIPSREWEPLRVSKESTPDSIERDIRDILAPPYPNGRSYPFHDGAASQLSQDRIRQVEGESQVLVREESRQLWHSLIAQPNLRPVDWMRSSTRRQHLIALGVPINLDELRVSDGAGSKMLPPLALKLDKKPSEAGGNDSNQRNGAHDGSKAKIPELDTARVKELTSLTEDQLTLLTLPALRDMSREMESLTRQASALLTHHLSQRESHNADAEMYNGLIRDLVTGAANRFGAAANVKRSSTLRKSSTGSGRNSPAPAAPTSQLR